MMKEWFFRLNTLKEVFTQGRGEEALKIIGKLAGFGQSPFVGDSPYKTAYNQGRLDLYTTILNMINKSPELMRTAIQQEEEQEQLQNSIKTRGEL